ncbi:MAG: secondary thiamine-phosphate synthase enzyme [Chloroflexi bacterium]|nr:secondary thiamine-phosphate synthase enzyme [Chloroflexota bacterium]|tara:strand:- start:2003 stop:2461 length:459 start_codon:yes stop_codon:yes gene_type:complete
MKTCTFDIQIPTSKSPDFIDITDNVLNCITDSEISNGIVLVFSKHTTAAISIQENEPLLLDDFKNLLENFSSERDHYNHNDFDVRTVHMHEDECPNGHSHCQHLLLGSSESIPLINGDIALGEWQRLFMVELDSQKAAQVSYRALIVQIMGE